jgi:hypothetical protein
MTLDRHTWSSDRSPPHWERRALHFDEDFGHNMNVSGDPLLDLVAAQEQRMIEDGQERRTRRRYAVWGDVPR